MKILEKYSHLNGEEYLLVHKKEIFDEIMHTINKVDANTFKTKISEEKTMRGKILFNPDALNREFRMLFRSLEWSEARYFYYVTTDYKKIEKLLPMSLEDQKKYMVEMGTKTPIRSYKQTDFVKDNVSIEVQFGKYAFVAYDLFVKHLLFYSGGLINVGIEILPMKVMQCEMSSGVAYFEGEVYNILRHGRNNPPVPLLILGIAP